MPGPVFDVFAGVFGATTAIVVCGGAVLLRWQRTKLRHALMFAALEKGVNALPGLPPLWLVSLRRGVSIMVLGVTLMLVGVAAAGNADKVPRPAEALTTQPAPPLPPVAAPPEFSPDGRPRPTPPPPESPAVHEWHRAQDQKSMGMLSLVVGLVLSALGLVRVVFAWIERKYARAAGIAI